MKTRSAAILVAARMARTAGKRDREAADARSQRIMPGANGGARDASDGLEDRLVPSCSSWRKVLDGLSKGRGGTKRSPAPALNTDIRAGVPWL